ncbi:hypothetical protein QSH57_005260 [Fusarium oxysporum f. sp. vasinfectum]|nr:hypothetical protein QSH57_005260 [Fusarium oxysporum f. sp. vasinfectum]
MARHHHLHEHQHDADQPDMPTMRGRPRHSEDETPGGNDEQRTEETAVNIVDGLPRTGLVVFDDCPAECDQVWPPQRRAPRSKTSEQKIDAQNETHAPSKDEVYDINPEYDDPKRNTGQNDANEEDTPNFEGHRPPLATFNLLRILPKVEIYARSTLFIRNPQESGPQTDICARIPGNDNNWAARVSCYDSLFDLYDWVRGNSSEESPEIWMYVSNIPHTFVNIKDILTVSLNEPVSIVAFANSVNPLPSGWTLVSLSPRPLLPGLREISGEDGAEWSE